MQRARGALGPFSATVSQAAPLTAVLAFGAAQFSDVLSLELGSDGLRLQVIDDAKSSFMVRCSRRLRKLTGQPWVAQHGQQQSSEGSFCSQPPAPPNPAGRPL